MTEDQNIVLVGFMGSGKTTIGRALAAATGLPQEDTDELIVRSAGMSIPEIFSTEGEEGFRGRETRMLEHLVQEGKDAAVYSTGGGIVMREENRHLLHRLGTVVWLRIAPHTVIERLGNDTSRPLLAGPDRDEKVHALIASRKEAYESSADLVVDVDSRTPEEIVQEILVAISKQN